MDDDDAWLATRLLSIPRFPREKNANDDNDEEEEEDANDDMPQQRGVGSSSFLRGEKSGETKREEVL